MNMQRMLSVGLLAAAIAVPVSQAVAADLTRGDDKDIKLTGCLIKGEGDGGYLITNLPSEPAASTAGTR